MTYRSSFSLLVVIVMCLLLQPGSASADWRESVGVGFQSSWPAWGVSGIYDYNETISAQGVLGVFGTVNTYSVRGLYRFLQEDKWNVYGYGMLGLWTYEYSHRRYDYRTRTDRRLAMEQVLALSMIFACLLKDCRRFFQMPKSDSAIPDLGIIRIPRSGSVLGCITDFSKKLTKGQVCYSRDRDARQKLRASD